MSNPSRKLLETLFSRSYVEQLEISFGRKRLRQRWKAFYRLYRIIDRHPNPWSELDDQAMIDCLFGQSSLEALWFLSLRRASKPNMFTKTVHERLALYQDLGVLFISGHGKRSTTPLPG